MARINGWLKANPTKLVPDDMRPNEPSIQIRKMAYVKKAFGALSAAGYKVAARDAERDELERDGFEPFAFFAAAMVGNGLATEIVAFLSNNTFVDPRVRYG
jgi:hypothetical protein